MSFLSRLFSDLLGTDRRPPNALMWKGEKEPFYNRWTYKINTADGDAYGFQAVVNNPWDTEGRFEFTSVYIFFDRYSRIEERNLMTMTDWPLEQFEASTERFEVSIGGNVFSDRVIKGSIHDEHHDKQIAFDLEITPVNGFLISDLGADGMFRGSFFNTLWQAPLTDFRASGTISIDDEVVEIDDAPGYQDTFYGPAVPDRWYWGQCNKFVEDPDASIVIGAGQIEILETKLPRILDTESFPVLAAVHHGGRKYTFNSLFDPADYHFDKGRIRLDVRKRFRGVRVVYESRFERAGMRAMDWHSPDDTNLESGMTLIAPATLKIYRRKLFGAWRLDAELSTPDAASICGGAKMDRASVRSPFLRNVSRTLFMAFYIGMFLLRGFLRLR